jgi:hypothetical protein
MQGLHHAQQQQVTHILAVRLEIYLVPASTRVIVSYAKHCHQYMLDGI